MTMSKLASIIFLLIFFNMSIPTEATSLEESLPHVTETIESVETTEICDTTETSENNSDMSIQGTVLISTENSETKEMSASTITAITSAITAICAIVIPNVTSVLKSRSEERKSRFEQYSPQVFAAMEEFTLAYSRFHRLKDYNNAGPNYKDTLDDEVPEIFKNFSAASYKLISLTPNRDLRDKIIKLLEALEKVQYVSGLEDALFQDIIKQLSYIISP